MRQGAGFDVAFAGKIFARLQAFTRSAIPALHGLRDVHGSCAPGGRIWPRQVSRRHFFFTLPGDSGGGLHWPVIAGGGHSPTEAGVARIPAVHDLHEIVVARAAPSLD